MKVTARTASLTTPQSHEGRVGRLMRRGLNPDLLSFVGFVGYRYRFLFVYVLIGVVSLGLELVVYRGLERLGVMYPFCAFVGVVSGILVAYWGNVRFNFKVPHGKRQRALLYFVVISCFSWMVQFLIRRRIPNWSYEEARLSISGAVFFLAYLLHRRFSFSDYKKVGVAVYANGIEDIKKVHARIQNFADIIHVDIVDASYGQQDHEVRTYRLEVVRAYWANKPIHVHVMSRTPSRYLRDILPHADRIYVHVEIDEDVAAVLAKVRQAGKQVGVALVTETPLGVLRPYLDRIDGVLFLAYLLHRRFSFSDYKKVGVAVYANGIEDIKKVHARIQNFADIIHVDIVDASYGQQDHEVRTYRLEVVRAYWANKPIHVHLMSRAPSRYLHDILPHADRIYVHVEIDEDVAAVLATVRQAGKQVGVALAIETPLGALRPYLDRIDGVLFLAISKPGSSGQSFEMQTLERLAEFNRWPERSGVDVCVDGGITEANVGLLNVEIVVSGSSVLTHADPPRQIMRLQTSSSYEQT